MAVKPIVSKRRPSSSGFGEVNSTNSKPSVCMGFSHTPSAWPPLSDFAASDMRYSPSLARPLGTLAGPRRCHT
jgi:hypothetical protein